MSGFSESALERKLAELTNSQQSIQTLSLWKIHHRRHHKAIVNVWLRELKKADPSRKLTFMYLANDVIQNSKKKGPEFVREFGSVLPKAFAHISVRNPDKNTHAGLRRILSVWQERNVFDAEQISEFDQYLPDKFDDPETAGEKNEAKKTRKSRPAPASKEDAPHWHGPEPGAKRRKPDVAREDPDKNNKDSKEKKPDVATEDSDSNAKDSEKKPREPPDPLVIVKALQDLEETASSDATVRERIASLPPEVSDVTLLEKIVDRKAAERLSVQVEEACALLADYNSRLNQEMDERKLVAQMLADFTEHQRELAALAEKKLQEHRDKLQKVTRVRDELLSHLQNLPDLSQLPSVTCGLAPLPSAGDLFSQN